MRDAIAYIRVSTTKQGRSGLGLEAQEATLAKFAEAEGFRFLKTFTETESGADDNRRELNAALEFARKRKAPMVETINTIDNERARVAHLKAYGRDARVAEQNLCLFEDSLAVFEDHLLWLQKARP
jgi:Resolvase, N terminal domain